MRSSRPAVGTISGLHWLVAATNSPYEPRQDGYRCVKLWLSAISTVETEMVEQKSFTSVYAVLVQSCGRKTQPWDT